MVQTKGWTAHLDKHLRVQSLLRPSKCIMVAFIWPLHIFMGCWTSFLGRTPWNLDYWDRIVARWYTYREKGPHNTGVRTLAPPLVQNDHSYCLSNAFQCYTFRSRGGEKFSSRVGEFANKTNAVKIWPCNIRLCWISTITLLCSSRFLSCLMLVVGYTRISCHCRCTGCSKKVYPSRYPSWYPPLSNFICE